MGIQANEIYRAQEPEMRQIASVSTLAKWRHQERGPPWTYSGSRVLYRGSDLITWLESSLVHPKKL